MFENLQDRLGSVLKGLTGRGALSEADVSAALREVRRALLEADVAQGGAERRPGSLEDAERKLFPVNSSKRLYSERDAGGVQRKGVPEDPEGAS